MLTTLHSYEFRLLNCLRLCTRVRASYKLASLYAISCQFFLLPPQPDNLLLFSIGGLFFLLPLNEGILAYQGPAKQITYQICGGPGLWWKISLLLCSYVVHPCCPSPAITVQEWEPSTLNAHPVQLHGDQLPSSQIGHANITSHGLVAK